MCMAYCSCKLATNFLTYLVFTVSGKMGKSLESLEFLSVKHTSLVNYKKALNEIFLRVQIF